MRRLIVEESYVKSEADTLNASERDMDPIWESV